ncbi:MAG TPA: OmpA family protein [Acidobacteriaceae bacterium]|nr:OmpA family protein [Acidobacteriaceae bacterium]
MTRSARSSKIYLGGASIFILAFAGCASKNYVRTQTTPLIQHTNELEDQTAANHRSIQDVDSRATQGIQQAQTAANTADQKALAAGQAASQAQQSAQEAMNHADTLESMVSNLDTYHQVADTNVHFAFDKATLTKRDKQDLDNFASQLGNTKSYILEITGGTDSTGDKQYNYQLSERRAETVAQYLAQKYNVPAHKFYLICIGKDVEVASNKNASGRAKNRRVEIQLLSNAQNTNGQPNPNAQGNSPGAMNSAPAATGQSNPPAANNQASTGAAQQ